MKCRQLAADKLRLHFYWYVSSSTGSPDGSSTSVVLPTSTPPPTQRSPTTPPQTGINSETPFVPLIVAVFGRLGHVHLYAHISTFQGFQEPSHQPV